MYYFNDIKGGTNMIFDSSVESALKCINKNEYLCFFSNYVLNSLKSAVTGQYKAKIMDRQAKELQG